MLSCVCGYHEYQRVLMARLGWRPSSVAAVGEELWCERERLQNPTDPCAVVVKKNSITVGKSTQKFRKCSMLLIIHVKKTHVLTFLCLAKP